MLRIDCDATRRAAVLLDLPVVVTKKERRRMLAREHYKRQQVRRAARGRRRRRRNIAIGVVLVAAVVVGVGWLLKAKVFDDDQATAPTDAGAVSSVHEVVTP
jgi:ferric-dicitrate binding protein FerR (iron transport regulator)